MDSNDILAKLLANENIQVVRGQVATASFNIGTRVLVLPQWQNLAADTEEMLILHEVGHALFTTIEYAEAQKDKPRSFGHYLNVVEDARIERKMKDRYPGARKTFMSGYADLSDRDFFEISGRDLSTYNFIDRINLYFKLGAKSGIVFSKQEMKYVLEIQNTDTINDVILTTERLYAFAKENAEEELERSMLPSIDDIDFQEEEDDLDSQLDNNYDYADSEDEDEEEFDENAEAQSYGGGASNTDTKDQKIEDKLESKTMKALDSKLQDSADTNTRFDYLEPSFYIVSKQEVVIDYKRVISEMTREMIDATTEEQRQKYDNLGTEFKRDNASIVNNMVKEFEMRKSASNWKRSRTAKTGQIDAKKLFGYQIKDELFKQLTVVKDGKKHGMIFLLDWSGSMSSYMKETVDQLINLAMFARRINVPFQVFAFTTNYNAFNELKRDEYTVNEKGIGSTYNYTLLELYNDRMSESEFTRMTSLLQSSPWNRYGAYALSGTPLNEALLHMVEYVGKFMQKNSVEKMIFITLTDGDGSSIRGERRISAWDYVDDDNGRRNVAVRTFIKDPMTGKQYTIDDDSPTQTRVLMSIIRDRYNVSNIGFNLISNRRSDVARLVNYTLQAPHDVYDLQLKLRSDRFVEIPNGAYNHYYVIDVKGLRVDNSMDLSGVNSDMSSARASKVFAKALGNNKTSRVVLNKFVSEVA